MCFSVTLSSDGGHWNGAKGSFGSPWERYSLSSFRTLGATSTGTDETMPASAGVVYDGDLQSGGWPSPWDPANAEDAQSLRGCKGGYDAVERVRFESDRSPSRNG